MCEFNSITIIQLKPVSHYNSETTHIFLLRAGTLGVMVRGYLISESASKRQAPLEVSFIVSQQSSNVVKCFEHVMKQVMKGVMKLAALYALNLACTCVSKFI